MTEQTSIAKFIEIDADGYFVIDSLRIADREAGQEWLAQIKMERGCAQTRINGETVIVEAFDQPYIALDIEQLPDTRLSIALPYGHREFIRLDSLTLDEWDRIHGYTERLDGLEPVPFVLSRSAQARLFNLVDDYDDESLSVAGVRIPTGAWLPDNPEAIHDRFWTNLYDVGDTGWDLGGPSHVLPSLLPQLKLQRARILVPGAGAGNDAAWLAEQGHIVTALDFSPRAIERAKERYGHLHDLKFVQGDVFNLPAAMNGAFDIVFEHTLYCAIAPSRRNELVKIWRRVLSERGHLLGVFFTMDRPMGPPFGGSEWELRSRLKNSFRPLYWTRLRDSRPARLGKELFVYAQKNSEF